ncbi:PAS domain S-box protein, partial [bacterium]
MMQTIADLKDRLGVAPTCAAMGVARSNFYRHQRPRPAHGARRPSPRALSPTERETALAVLHEPRFVDLAPAQVYTQLLDDNRYLCSERTLYRLLAEHSTDMISRHGPDGVYTYVSPSSLSLLGWRPEELAGRPAHDFYHPDDLQRMRQSHETLAERPADSTVTYRFRRKDGSYTWLETTSKEIQGPFGSPEIIANSRDVSSRKSVEEERDRLFTYSVDLLCVAGYDGYLKQLNPAWSQTLGWSEEELLSRPWMELIHPDDASAAEAIRVELAKERSIFSLEIRYRKKDGSYLWMSWNIFSLAGEQLIFADARDVTARKEVEERLRLLAAHDGLTGSYNRRTWFDLSEKELDRSRRHGFELSVLMIDLDRFKEINDTYGHAAGDEVLKAVPRVFAAVLRGHDVVGRIGGVEFAVALTQCDRDTASGIAERLRTEAESTEVPAGPL